MMPFRNGWGFKQIVMNMPKNTTKNVPVVLSGIKTVIHKTGHIVKEKNFFEWYEKWSEIFRA